MKILHQIFSPHNLLVMLFVVLLQTSLAMHLHNNIKQNTKKPWTICRQQKMIDKNLIFSPAKFIVPIFDLSNHLDFLTYRLIHWLSVMLQTINRRSCTITEKVPTCTFSWLKADTTAFTFKTLLRHYAN